MPKDLHYMFTFTSQNQNQHGWSCLLLFPFPGTPFQWPGHQNTLLEPTQLCRHLSLHEWWPYICLSKQFWAELVPHCWGHRVANLLIMKKGHGGEKHLPVCKMWMTEVILIPSLLDTARAHETWVSCFLNCLTTKATSCCQNMKFQWLNNKTRPVWDWFALIENKM